MPFTETEAVLGELVARACDWGVEGDMNHAGSPLDPAFWPTHPTVDRLFQWRRLNGMTNDWIDNDSWSVQGVDVGYCLGHNLHDLLPYTNLFEHDAGPYSNAQMWNLTDPLNTHSPYVYDSFEWAHCVDEGYSSDLLERVGLPDGNERWRALLPQPVECGPAGRRGDDREIETEGGDRSQRASCPEF